MVRRRANVDSMQFRGVSATRLRRVGEVEAEGEEEDPIGGKKSQGNERGEGMKALSREISGD